ncbi:hypothetical protein R3P38DRAFT_111274 [Favolaschia claudopus]|uniref:Uncharacterized protein n=1 Tax=Favolaschia claudopus TaxID=2862362 RepID=A0AAV9ZXW6_9AGAR
MYIPLLVHALLPPPRSLLVPPSSVPIINARPRRRKCLLYAFRTSSPLRPSARILTSTSRISTRESGWAGAGSRRGRRRRDSTPSALTLPLLTLPVASICPRRDGIRRAALPLVRSFYPCNETGLLHAPRTATLHTHPLHHRHPLASRPVSRARHTWESDCGDECARHPYPHRHLYWPSPSSSPRQTTTALSRLPNAADSGRRVWVYV